MFEKVLKANPNHHPAGSPKGGQFAPSKGKALDTYSLISGLSRKGVEVVDSKSDITRYIDDLNRIGEDTRGMGYIESEAEWNTILRNVYEETDRLKAEHGIDIRETRGMVILMRSNPHEGAGGVYERENQIIMVSGSDATHASSKEAEGFHSQNGMHWSVSAKAMYEEGKDAGIKATFRHELGHHFSLQRKSVYEAVTDNLMGSKYNPDWFAKNVTYYGAVSVEEMMAEVFAHATSPTYKPQSLPIEFERIVDAMKSPTKVSRAIKSAFSKDLLCPSRDAELDIPDTWVSSPFKRLEREPKVHMSGNVLKFNPNHDKLGRFATRNSPSALDKRLVDYKPDRTLSDPSKVSNITDVVQGAGYVPYSAMPFLKTMHKAMGIPDPFAVPVNEYMAARKALFKQQPVVDLPLNHLVVTQKVVNTARIEQGMKAPEGENDAPIMAVRYKGNDYIINGHHRVVSYAKRGSKAIKAMLLDMDGIKKSELVFKFNPHHDKLGRFAKAPAGGKAWESNEMRVLSLALNAKDLPEKARHLHASEDAIYANAPQALNHMQEWLDLGKGVASRLGYKTMTKAPDAMTNEEWAEKGGMLFIANIKGKDRAREKVNADYKGDWGSLLDIVRATVAVDNLGEVVSVVRELEASGMQLARVPKDRLNKPTKEHYRDILLNVTLPNGLIGELQIHLKPMLIAKSVGHKHYEVIRSLEAKYGENVTTDKYDAADSKAYNQALLASQRIYDEAWQKLNRG